MPWHLEFQYSFDDLREANAAHARHLSKGHHRANLIGWIFFIGLAICFFIILQSRQRGAAPLRPPRPSLTELYEQYKVLAWSALFAVAWVFFFFWNRRQLRKRFEQEPTVHQLQRVDVTDDGLTHASLTTSTTYKWDAFVRHVESPNLFLLYLNDTTFDLIPKRAFRDTADVDAFRQFLARTINPPGRAFPVLPPKP